MKLIRDLAGQYGPRPFEAVIAASWCMDWTEPPHFAADPLCTIGAGTAAPLRAGKARAGAMRATRSSNRSAYSRRSSARRRCT